MVSEAKDSAIHDDGEASRLLESDNERLTTDGAAWGRTLRPGAELREAAPSDLDAAETDTNRTTGDEVEQPTAHRTEREIDAAGWGRSAVRPPGAERDKVADRDAISQAMIQDDDIMIDAESAPDNANALEPRPTVRAERDREYVAAAPDQPTEEGKTAEFIEPAEFTDDRRLELECLAIVDLQAVGGDHSNTVYIAELVDGSHGYLKPESGEEPELRGSAVPENEQWRREVAVCDVDRALKLGLVPDTVQRHELSKGIANASLQAEAPLESRPYDTYSNIDRQKMAVLDYVIANTDRHHQNYKTGESGQPAAIDNGLSLPVNDSEGIRSQWVADQLGRPLDTALVQQLRAVDEKNLLRTLREDGIATEAISGLMERLHEVQLRGAILGEAWHGEIYGGDTFPCWNLIRERLY